MGEVHTCGKGLAANSVIPAIMSEFLASLANNLELHMESLVLNDPDAKLEHDAYASLVGQYKTIASKLAVAADEMAGYEDLPMGEHDEQVLSEARVISAFEAYVQLEGELLELLQSRYQDDRRMIEDTR